MEKINAIGLMSGTSVDGLDICFAEYYKRDDTWSFKILAATTYKFPLDLKQKLQKAIHFSGYELALLNIEFGEFCGKKVNEFTEENNLKKTRIDLIASHGHTIFHQPNKKLTLQIGCGKTIAEISKIPVINDFRTTDVLLGGQGAPLVPIGDKYLFSEYEACINLGGFSNISFNKNNKRIAYDICPVNIVLNKLCETLNKPFDENGDTAKKGKINSIILNKLNHLEYYNLTEPKSLGLEWVEQNIFKLLKNDSVENLLATMTEHCAVQIVAALSKNKIKNVLFTGGGVFNTFLMEKIKNKYNGTVYIPNNTIVEYKESLIFGFIGVLKSINEINVLSSYTGAKKDSCSGTIYIPV